MLSDNLSPAAPGYDAVGMVVDAAIARLDAAEAGAPDAPVLTAAALPPLERAGYLRELARARRLG